MIKQLNDQTNLFLYLIRPKIWTSSWTKKELLIRHKTYFKSEFLTHNFATVIDELIKFNKKKTIF